MIDPKTPIWKLTVGELLEILTSVNPTNQNQELSTKVIKSEYAYGIDGLADILGCSRRTAQNIKSSGLIDEAISQTGRKTIFNKKLVLELLNEKSSKQKK